MLLQDARSTSDPTFDVIHPFRIKAVITLTFQNKTRCSEGAANAAVAPPISPEHFGAPQTGSQRPVSSYLCEPLGAKIYFARRRDGPETTESQLPPWEALNMCLTCVGYK